MVYSTNHPRYNRNNRGNLMSKKILIVDDVEFIVKFEEEVLNAMSKEFSIKIDIDSANNLKDALKKIEVNTYDAMIIDMNLPDGSGVDIAKAAQEKNTATRIAALTIYPHKYEEHREYFDALYKKPISPASYKQNVRKLLDI